MTSSINIQLTDELRSFINAQVSDTGLYSTPSELVRDLIRRHKQTVEQQEHQRVTDMLVAVKQKQAYYQTDGKFFDHIRDDIDQRFDDGE